MPLRLIHSPLLTLSAPCSPVEVAVHTILYVRHVYPADLFVRRRKYDTPVYQSRHPALNEYIAGAVKAVTDELALVSAFHSSCSQIDRPVEKVITDCGFGRRHGGGRECTRLGARTAKPPYAMRRRCVRARMPLCVFFHAAYRFENSCHPSHAQLTLAQGTVDKVVLVIKNTDEKPLERFIFALRNTLQVESYNKDTRSPTAVIH